MYKINEQKTPLREWVQLGLQVGGVVTIIAGLWLTTRLSPLDGRLQALEKIIENREPLVERFIQLEQRDAQLVNDIKEMKEDLKRLMVVHRLQP